MTSGQKLKSVYWIALAAGLMDASSGLLLMLAPKLALELMRITPPDVHALVYIRFIGGFVFSVGSLYLIGLWRVYIANERVSLAILLGATAWVRLVICVLTASAIATGALSLAWGTVTLTDGCLAVLQFYFVAKKWIHVDVAL